ncbi:MAG: hypothetical protein MUC50_13270, partial [Myxococcota bacterium]|nr:hypothetical protein [Myxococcota bacterium]
GLALALDGWLRSGIRKGVAALSLQVPARAALTREVVHREIKPTLHTVLLTESTDLAAIWLESMQTKSSEHADFSEAVELIQAVRNRSRQGCGTNSDHKDPLALEKLYWCRDYESLLAVAKQIDERGYAQRAARFFVAEANLKLGHLEAARQQFERLEKDPLVRAEFPVSAILALERLARLSEKSGDTESAKSYWRRFLEIWPGLDIPLTEHLTAREALADEHR